MIYRPFSKSGLVTLPKEAREFLGLDSNDGKIIIEQVGRFQARIVGLNSELDKLLPRRRITNKGQFTIPANILRSWGITGKGEVSFHIQEPYLIVSLVGPEIGCKLCESAGTLLGHPCIVCDGTGKMRLHPMGALGEFASVTMNARKFGITLHTEENDTGVPQIHVSGSLNLPAAYLKLVEIYFKSRLQIK
ncbi:AbrB/MazE/SpoVT family DNA-binding domain-containing protein [Paenibacillus oralis]|uniref:AbrB/MazE/SpoVT family DNA-binding domain-containing protein n=1 Tax=Paenibacillus oralis TaxID=2490856 RepID=A0A3P3TBB0_9BACL|nr:AbrB/MazE/SpoVT family DNA-binding domain-containing protein [Paenibacillus oralis]RRJ54814.1 AbrB/MazE/SpoVT family DNA-binding domain-containing protein [Paenibacillus oralis]